MDGEIYCDGTACIAAHDNSSVQMSGGTLSGAYYGFVCNNADLSMDSGKIIATGTALDMRETGTATVKGGYLQSSSNYAVCIRADTKLFVEGGEFYQSGGYACVFSGGTVKIQGSSAYLHNSNANGWGQATITINSGVFTFSSGTIANLNSAGFTYYNFETGDYLTGTVVH